MARPIFAAWAAFALAMILCSSSGALALDVSIKATNADLASLSQMPLEYNGWKGWGIDPPPPNPLSVWGNDQGTSWGANPNIVHTPPGEEFIRTVAHGSSAGTAILAAEYDLAGASGATLSATFRAKYTNNTVNLGTPLLSISLADAPGISLNVGDKDYSAGNPDHYWYQLVQFKQDGPRRLLYAIAPIDPANPTAQEDPNWETARIVVDKATKRVQLWWNNVKVFEQVVEPFSGGEGDPVSYGTISQASWGSDTVVQPLPAQGGSGSEQKVFWKEIRLMDGGLCGTPFADADGDHDVDQEDFGVFQACYTGSAGSIVDPPQGYLCACFNRDSDGLINAGDLAEFEKCATGPAIVWSQQLKPACSP